MGESDGDLGPGVDGEGDLGGEELDRLAIVQEQTNFETFAQVVDFTDFLVILSDVANCQLFCGKATESRNIIGVEEARSEAVLKLQESAVFYSHITGVGVDGDGIFVEQANIGLRDICVNGDYPLVFFINGGFSVTPSVKYDPGSAYRING